jgi:hypothetical protein
VDKAQDREHRQAWTRFDRLTAYGCGQRDRPYVVSAMQEAWTAYALLFDPMLEGYHYGDARDG